MKKFLTFFIIFILAQSFSQYAVAQDKYSEGLLWKVSKEGVQVGHVFGTIHINDERVTRIPKVVSDIFNESKGYAIEAFPSSHLWNPYHGWQDIKKRMMLEGEETLEDVAGKELADTVQRIMTNNGVSADYAKKIKPWAAMFSIATKSTHTGPIIDHKLLDIAKIQEKELYQVESPEELLAAFYAMPMESQVSLLNDKVKAFPEMSRIMDKMILAYLKEDLSGMMQASTDFINKEPAKKAHHDAYIRHAINIRNVVMAHYSLKPFRDAIHWLDYYKGKSAGAFVSIGALHLEGEKGILSLLENNYGLELERIPVVFN